jgi:hypothetical protein
VCRTVRQAAMSNTAYCSQIMIQTVITVECAGVSFRKPGLSLHPRTRGRMYRSQNVQVSSGSLASACKGQRWAAGTVSCRGQGLAKTTAWRK